MIRATCLHFSSENPICPISLIPLLSIERCSLNSQNSLVLCQNALYLQIRLQSGNSKPAVSNSSFYFREKLGHKLISPARPLQAFCIYWRPPLAYPLTGFLILISRIAIAPTAIRHGADILRWICNGSAPG